MKIVILYIENWNSLRLVLSDTYDAGEGEKELILFSRALLKF